MKINVDGSEKELNDDMNGYEIAKELNKADKVIAVRINGTISDLSTVVSPGDEIEFIGFASEEGKEIFKHSAAHVLAIAAKRVFPDIKLTIGPAVEDGFYYDFDTKAPFTPEDLEKLENEMRKVVDEDIVFERIELSTEEAIRKSKEQNEPYKVEMINDLGDEQITFYKNGEFVDLCRGPHVYSTGCIKAFKLTKIAGAYWRGKSENKQLQRVYGVAFPEKKELKQYLHLLEEAEKRNHRKIGRELELFSFHDEGAGFPFWLPKGMTLKNQLIDFWRTEHKKAGYVEISTPIMLNKTLWETSGHWENYRENMYLSKIDDQDFAIKPMNCPGGMLVYKEKIHSYRDFPMRVGELGLVHRHELSGVLSGLFRVRVFTQDDAHIFMTEEQIKSEILNVIKLTEKFYRLFGFSYQVELSTRPEKSIGSDEQWTTATEGLQDALNDWGIDYKINEGDGAFYGPKIDFHLTDCIGRTWQCGTIQLDMSLPERFDLTYEAKDGTKKRPVMIHRVIYGSIERFIGILTEHYAGKFPLWLNPMQVRILSVADKFEDYARIVQQQLESSGLRVEVDSRSESVGKKIREAQLAQVNYILVVGEAEEKNKTVNVRTRNNKVIGEKDAAHLIRELQQEVNDKK